MTMTVTTADGSAPAAPRSSAAGFAAPAAAAVAASAVFLLVHDALIDDAYITMSYARNVGLHLHWGLIPDQVANSATSPLNVLLLGAATAVVRDGVVAVGVLFVGSVALAARWLHTLAAELELSRWLPALAVGLLLVNPLMLSTVGLEPYMCTALLAGLLRYGAAGRVVGFGLVAGLTVLARPDVGVVVAVVSLVLPAVRRRLLVAVAAALAVVLPWCAFSWFVLGSVVPDTLVIKAGSETWSGFEFRNGPLLYLDAAAGGGGHVVPARRRPGCSCCWRCSRRGCGGRGRPGSRPRSPSGSGRSPTTAPTAPCTPARTTGTTRR